MTRLLLWVTSLAVVALVAGFGSHGIVPDTYAQTTCNQTTLSGGYAMGFSGVLVQTGYRSNVFGVGRIAFDGKGSISGTFMRNVDSKVDDQAFTGTYSASPDCTGTFALTFAGTTQQYKMVIGDRGRQVLWMRTEPAAFVAGGTFIKQ
jgi:hypothetical protein